MASVNRLDINKLFGEIDKFCAHILSIPAAAVHPDVKKYLEVINASKDKFRQVYAEHLADLSKAHAQLDAAATSARERAEASRKKIEEMQSSETLDGNALGRALLKNLGFMD